MILSDVTIAAYLNSGYLKIDPMPPDECLQPASVDVHLSDHIVRMSPSGESHKNLCAYPHKEYLLGAGEFILASTEEWLELPGDVLCRVEGKSSLARRGLMVHITAGFVDPGWKGNITLELKNVGSQIITLTSRMKIAQFSFLEVDQQCARPYGHKELGSKYQGSQGPRL